MRRSRRTLICVCALLALAGCGGIKRVPVTGKVTLAGKPLTSGRLGFSPDEAKGNSARVACFGKINAEGEYELATLGVNKADGGRGVPPGWYKVTLLDVESLPKGVEVAPEYFDENQTPLAIEIVAEPAPGAYDLHLNAP
jgi:hypothetical protein